MKIAPEKRMKVAKDFYKTTLSLSCIADKYNVSPSTVTNISKEYQEQILIPEPKDLIVIKIESKWVGNVKELLNRRGIAYEIPTHFELTEYYQSKIN